MSIQTERPSTYGDALKLAQTFKSLDPLRQQRADSFYILLGIIRYLQNGMVGNPTLEKTHAMLSRASFQLYTALAYSSKYENGGLKGRVVHEQGKEVADRILKNYGYDSEDLALSEVPLG